VLGAGEPPRDVLGHRHQLPRHAIACEMVARTRSGQKRAARTDGCIGERPHYWFIIGTIIAKL
jgi:hypothetical protein